MSQESEVAMLDAFFRRLGAEPSQARVMALQTRKRAAQLSEERGVSEVEALRYLMELAEAGRSGQAPLIRKPGESNGDKVEG